MSDTRPVRTILFVPADRPDRFSKALATSADLVCIDLEDAIAANAKDKGRQTVSHFLSENGSSRVAVRCNSVKDLVGLRDLLMLAEVSNPPEVLVIPKVESFEEVQLVAGAFEGTKTQLVPAIETPSAVAHASQIARAPRCLAMAFGGGDLSACLGIAMSWEALLFSRSAVVQACSRAQVSAWDVPYLDLADDKGLGEETVRAKALGFSAKIALHPRQLEVIQSAFQVSDEQVREATEALRAFEAGGRRGFTFNGSFLDAPIMRKYQDILKARGIPYDGVE